MAKSSKIILAVVIVGVVAIVGYVIKSDPFGDAYTFNQSILSTNSNDIVDRSIFNPNPIKAPDFQGIERWLNTPNGESISLTDLRGKVVLIDFWTYSCINCIRTLPYITEWDRKYRDQGLVIIGVHSPEFQFEKSADNVLNAIAEHNIEYPVAQDNDFKTWRAYRNQFWPAKYFIDHKGNIVWQHFGEGQYDESEKVIQQLLKDAGLIESGLGLSDVQGESVKDKNITPELYFGYSRLSPPNFSNWESIVPTPSGGSIPTRVAAKNLPLFNNPIQFSPPLDVQLHSFFLEGDWKIGDESSKLESESGKIVIHYRASKVNIVMQADAPVVAEVLIDGRPLNQSELGDDVVIQNGKSITTIQPSQLYNFINTGDEYEEHTLELIFQSSGAEAFAFTFG
ncbi:MAG: thiol-disulfide isomerase [Candidatus Buchananbacteria bacterium CG10_big_fil_rev_8_21_14_0_10_42_9]|uniref:Thiol-disulfide isomerase n=1 Tax=Candidatus Buchananbacteria bacterium CG10_big_fil_rev_8_21_14_0_10_42_9 TaxID=1974526 RepID=A0A2H0W1M8_9BACT|nr:MAG: thiol-disulfide isomerase [Candidatus Buchananbacteria bacterium CG10_big_fil_rev_8_21_14_0_10_42_9]